MTASVLLQSVVERLQTQIQAVERLKGALSPDQLNWSANPNTLTMGQLLDHMLIAAEPYRDRIKAAVAAAKKGSGDSEIKYSFFGKIIYKASGPDGNVPMPKKMLPGKGPFVMEIVDRWINVHQEILSLAKTSNGIDLSSVKIKNPFLPLFSMNLADFYVIPAAHAERHVGQMLSLETKLP